MQVGTAEPSSSKGHRRAVFCVALLALGFFAGSLLAPLLENRGSSSGALLKLAYAPLCHQMPERSLRLGEAYQAVCARCSGLYLGGIGGILAGGWLFVGSGRRPKPVWLFWSLAPTVIDALLPWIGLPGLTNVPRLVLAFPAGLVAGMFLVRAVAEVVSSRTRSRLRAPIEIAQP